MILKVAIAGLGIVGSGVLRILHECEHVTNNKTIILTAVSSRSEKLELVKYIGKAKRYDNAIEMAISDDIDLIVETIGGKDGVAYDLCRAALMNGKHVVTANKAMLAEHGTELASIAEKTGVILAFEAAVGGAMPFIKLIRDNLVADKIEEIYAIINGTCNFILDNLATDKNMTMAQAIELAQKAGFAEADPSFDIDGIDAAQKLAIISTIAFKKRYSWRNSEISGIRFLTQYDIAAADQMGYHFKLIAHATHNQQNSIALALVPKNGYFAAITGGGNIASIRSRYIGTTIISAAGAGSLPTAASVVGDIIDIAENRASSLPFGVPADLLVESQLYKSEQRMDYYLRYSSKGEVVTKLQNLNYEELAIAKYIAKQELNQLLVCPIYDRL